MKHNVTFVVSLSLSLFPPTVESAERGTQRAPLQ